MLSSISDTKNNDVKLSYLLPGFKNSDGELESNFELNRAAVKHNGKIKVTFVCEKKCGKNCCKKNKLKVPFDFLASAFHIKNVTQETEVETVFYNSNNGNLEKLNIK